MKKRILLFLGFCLLAGFPDAHAAPVALFDEGHGQPFQVGGHGPLDLSSLAERFTIAGFEVRTAKQPLDAGGLAGIDVLVISGAFQPLTAAELSAVRTFLAEGGGLAVMLHIAPPLAGLLDILQVDYANGILHDTSHAIDNNSLNFRVLDLKEHPLTLNVKGFAVYGTWALRSLDPSVVTVAHTSVHGWVDLNSDGQLNGADAAGSFGLMAAGASGQGRFVVFGDDALFQNRFLEGNNQILADRLVDWLRR